MSTPHRRALVVAASLACGIAVLAASRAAHAEVSCYHWDSAKADLLAKYGEVPTYGAQTDAGAVIVTVNPKTLTWTEFLETSPNIVCLIAEGDHWGAPPADATPSPSPAPQTDPSGI